MIFQNIFLISLNHKRKGHDSNPPIFQVSSWKLPSEEGYPKLQQVLRDHMKSRIQLLNGPGLEVQRFSLLSLRREHGSIQAGMAQEELKSAS